jgi:hypothetical protein
MNNNSTNQEKIKYAEYGTPYTIRTQMLKTILPSFWKNKSNKIFESLQRKLFVSNANLILGGVFFNF